MTTNTYRLAVALQAKAIDSIDLHAEGSFAVTHTFGADITVVARYRTGAGQRILQMLARDADAHLLGSAEAAVPVGGGLIASHVTAFRSGHCAGNAGSSPPAQYRNPAELPCGARGHPSHARSGSTPTGAPTTTSATTGRPAARPRHHLVAARRHRAHRPRPGPHQGRHRHRRRLRGRLGDPTPGPRLTPRAHRARRRAGPVHNPATDTTSRTETTCHERFHR